MMNFTLEKSLFNHGKAWAALTAGLILTFFPKSETPVLLRLMSHPLAIHGVREYPPQEAFQQILRSTEDDPEWNKVESVPSIDLNSAVQDFSPGWNPVIELNQINIKLPALHFARAEVQTLRDPETIVAGISAEDQVWVDALPNSEKQMLLLAQQTKPLLSQSWAPPSWKNLVEKKLNEVNPKTTTPISKTFVAALSKNGQWHGIDSIHTADVKIREDKVSSQIIRGKIRLAAGLALGDRNLTLTRMLDGLAVDSGQIDVEHGSFVIPVAEYQGSLELQLVDQKGTVLASGHHVIVPEDAKQDVNISVFEDHQFAGTFINFNKEPNHLISERISSSQGQPAEILYASLGVTDKTNAVGDFSFAKISNNSMGLIRARAPGFQETLLTHAAGSSLQVPLFTQSLVKSLREIVESQRSIGLGESGMIWGQVIFDKKALKGVSVHLEDDPEAVPVYLNGFIPQPDLKATTENGYFIFVGLKRGLHSVIATRNSELFGHLNLEVDDNAVAVGNLEASSENKEISLKVYDAFLGTPQSAQVHLQSINENMSVIGQAQIYLQQLARLGYGFVQPEKPEYLPYQMTYKDSDDFIHVPLVKRDWIENLSQQQRISNYPDTGTVIGFVPEDDFEAYLSHEDAYQSDNIVYFDHEGRVSAHGVAGGGFVMFNVPSSTQSVVVLSKKSETLSTRVIPVEPGSNSVLKFGFNTF